MKLLPFAFVALCLYGCGSSKSTQVVSSSSSDNQNPQSSSTLSSVAALSSTTLLSSTSAISSSASSSSFTALPLKGFQVLTWPAIGDTGTVRGLVHGYNPSAYKIAAYVFTDSWYNKPGWTNSTTSIQKDSSFALQIASLASDTDAYRFALFLVPTSYAPPVLGQDSASDQLPAALYANAVDSAFSDRHMLNFAGRKWFIKRYESTTAGPGPNYFSGDSNDVFTDANGDLHLRISQRNGRWYSTEVISYDGFGYGAFTFNLAGQATAIPNNAILGMFLWDDVAHAQELNKYHEIDFELSRWGNSTYANFQNVVQPDPYVDSAGGNRHRFELNTQQSSIHRFLWSQSSIDFRSAYGNSFPQDTAQWVSHWAYTGTRNPLSTGSTRIHLNLWLMNGVAPSTGAGSEIVLTHAEWATP